LAALNAAERSRNSWGISDTFDAFDARLESAGRYNGTEMSMLSLMVDMSFVNKSQRMGWYRWMSEVPIVKKCLTAMVNECVSPNEKDQYANLAFSRNFKKMLHPHQIDQLQMEFDYVCGVCLKSDDRTLWDLFWQWLVDGEMFWEIIPNREGNRVIGVNILNPSMTYPIYERGRIIGFVENMPVEYAEALGMKPDSLNLIKFKPYQVAYCNYGKYGICKYDVKGWMEPSVRSLNQLIQMEDSLLAIRVNRAVERLLVNVNTGGGGPALAKEALQEAKKEYNKTMNYDTHSGRVLHRSRNISLKEMFWFAIDKDGNKTTIESLTQNTNLNGQIEDVKVFEKNVYDALEIPESRRGSGTDATYTNKHDLGLQEMSFAQAARRLSSRFAQNMVKKVFVQHLALRGYSPKYVNGDNYIVQMNRNNYYEKARIFELMSTRGELLNSWANYIATAENKHPLISRNMLLAEILQFPPELLDQNEKWLKEERMDMADAGEEDGGDGLGMGDEEDVV